MAEQVANATKKYPRDDEDVKYEKEIIDAIKKLPLEQRLQIIALNNYTLIRKRLDVHSESQIEDIVRKYNKTQAPIMNELNKIIAGKRAPTEEEVQIAKEHLASEEVEKISENLTAEAIPEYWFKVLTSCIRLKEDIHDVDHPLLKSLTMIEHIPEEEGEDFTFKFYFAPNEYFENDVLTIKFVMTNEHEVKKTEASEIKWKEGKDITKKTVTKKQKNKKTGKTRTITKTADADSFFTFFRSIEAPEDAEDDEEEENEDAQRLGINQEIAVALQDEIVPHHLEYYLGLRVGDEDDEGFYPGHGGEDEDDEEGDEDEEEHGGHRHTKNCSHSHSHKHKPSKGDNAEGGAKGGEKQECKQQ
jgi:nucleosome assembly protein 1-like 1